MTVKSQMFSDNSLTLVDSKLIVLQVCENSSKYTIGQGSGSFTIVIHNPEPEDTGCYK